MRQPDFIILALPRSRTAWLANFLTTDKTFCYHDPVGLMTSYKEVFDLCIDGRLTGLSDTGLGYFDTSIFTCPKLIIERDINEVNARMNCDMTSLQKRLEKVKGIRIKFEDINDRLEEIWNYCTGLPYDKLRGDFLKNMNIQLKDLPFDNNLGRYNKLVSEMTKENS